jgi:hypothetical protein
MFAVSPERLLCWSFLLEGWRQSSLVRLGMFIFMLVETNEAFVLVVDNEEDQKFDFE